MAVEVICIGYPGGVVRTMAALLELEDRERLAESAEELVNHYPRYRRELRQIVETIANVRFTAKAPVIVLLSLDDNSFKIMC